MWLVKIKPLRQEQPAEWGLQWLLLGQRWQEEGKAYWCRCQLWWHVSTSTTSVCNSAVSKAQVHVPATESPPPNTHTHTHTHTQSLSLQVDVKSIWLAASEHLLASPNTTYPTSASVSHLKVFSLKVPPSLSLPSETQLLALSGIWVSALVTLVPSIPRCQERISEARWHPSALIFSTLKL